MQTILDRPWTHRFEPGRDAKTPPLLLLHGTGGDENDLLPLGRALSPGSALLSPRGRVSENGMPRFFRRLAEGVFDEADVRQRADELAAFIADARQRYGLPAPIAVGFSNGANIAAAVLLAQPQALAGAALIRAMVPLAARQPEEEQRQLAGKPVLLLSGAADPIVPAANAAALATRLGAAGADVEQHTLPVGHGLTPADVALAQAWLRRLGGAAT